MCSVVGPRPDRRTMEARHRSGSREGDVRCESPERTRTRERNRTAERKAKSKSIFKNFVELGYLDGKLIKVAHYILI